MRVLVGRALQICSALLFFAFCYRTATGWYEDFRGTQAARIAAERLSEETVARLTATRVERDSLAELLKAAKQLNGKLIAGARVNIPARDTLIIVDSIPWNEPPATGTTRTASFRDSTFAGIIEGTITAPPEPAMLGLRYTITRPAFSPQFGIVRSGNAHLVVVNWAGERAEVAVPFADIPLPPKRMRPYVEAQYSPAGVSAARAGVGFTLKDHWMPTAEIGTYLFDTKFRGPVASLGLRYIF